MNFMFLLIHRQSIFTIADNGHTQIYVMKTLSVHALQVTISQNKSVAN